MAFAKNVGGSITVEAEYSEGCYNVPTEGYIVAEAGVEAGEVVFYGSPDQDGVVKIVGLLDEDKANFAEAHAWIKANGRQLFLNEESVA
jgi:hypothetical protein